MELSTNLRTVQSKPEEVRNISEPTSIDKVKSFLGLTEYYKQFIKGYADIPHPLTSILRKDATFTWGPAQQNVYAIMKIKLTSSPELIFLDYTKEFILCTDA